MALGLSLVATGCGGHGAAGPASHPPLAPPPGPDATLLRAAAAAMQRAQSFTFSGSVAVGGTTTSLAGRFSAPDRSDVVVTVPGGKATEVLFAGTKAYVRTATGWVDQLNGASAPADPRAAFSVLQDAVDVQPAAGGSGPGTHLRFHLPARAVASLLRGAAPGTTGVAGATGSQADATGTATVLAGVITQLAITVPVKGSVLATTVSYSSVGTSPPVTLPGA